MEQSVTNTMFLAVPLMHKEKFAELVGVTYGVVDGWCIRGYLPTKIVGKHQLVNLVALTQECIDELPR